MSPDKSEPRVYYTYSKVTEDFKKRDDFKSQANLYEHEFIFKPDYDQAIQLKDAEITKLKEESDFDHMEYKRMRDELQEKLTQAEAQLDGCRKMYLELTSPRATEE